MSVGSIFRQYTYDDSFLQVYVSSKFLKEYQIALLFARDYDDNDDLTNGIFHIYWDQSKVTPSSISQFKNSHPDVALKLFLVIGDNNINHYPFHPLDPKTWVSNATSSLSSIIKDTCPDLGVTGIDVYYRHIDTSPDVFVGCMGQLLKNLKEEKVVTVASISPSASVNNDYYVLLYRRFEKVIEWVDYQFQNEDTFVGTPEDLEDRYEALVTSSFYPRKKLIAGYSAENQDWAQLSPIVFFLGGSDLFKKKKVAGFSIVYHDFGDHHDHHPRHTNTTNNNAADAPTTSTD